MKILVIHYIRVATASNFKYGAILPHGGSREAAFACRSPKDMETASCVHGHPSSGTSFRATRLQAVRARACSAVVVSSQTSSWPRVRTVSSSRVTSSRAMPVPRTCDATASDLNSILESELLRSDAADDKSARIFRDQKSLLERR
jgi:hypothetical protein